MELDLLKHWDRLYSALIRDQHAKNIFDREKLKNKKKTCDTFCRYPDNFHSTLAMTSDTLCHSTPRFDPFFCCNCAVITVYTYESRQDFSTQFCAQMVPFSERDHLNLLKTILFV